MEHWRHNPGMCTRDYDDHLKPKALQMAWTERARERERERDTERERQRERERAFVIQVAEYRVSNPLQDFPSVLAPIFLLKNVPRNPFRIVTSPIQ